MTLAAVALFGLSGLGAASRSLLNWAVSGERP
jgi:hypothetical protein